MSDNNHLSRTLFAKAAALMPGGVSSPVRAFQSVGGDPIFFRRAQGAELTDVDGRTYVDFCLSWGPLILGHLAASVREAVGQAVGEGLTFGACSPREIELAERVLSALPGAERVRFVNSGTEAVMTAIRLARGATGRAKILKFEGCYHGHSDGLLVKAGSGLATSGIASSAGVPPQTAADTLVAPLDDEAAIDALFDQHGDDLAAAIIEPIPANAGLLEQRPEFLRHLRRRCRDAGALFIADEVITGFRFRYGLISDAFDLSPDLVTMGKIVGGGLPVGALAGSAALMEQLAPLGPVYQAGTLSGNPVAMAAGAATLGRLADGQVYDRLDALGEVFDETLREAGADVPWLKWRRRGSVIWLHLDDGEIPRRSDRVAAGSIERFAKLHPALRGRGFYLPPSGWEVFFLCDAHTEEQVADLAGAIGEICAGLD